MEGARQEGARHKVSFLTNLGELGQNSSYWGKILGYSKNLE